MSTVRWRARPVLSFRGRLPFWHRASDVRTMSPLERRALVALRPNILIEGEESDVEKTLVALTADFRPGTCEWSAIRNSPSVAGTATIIVREITSLSHSDLRRLTEWLDTSSPRVQLIVTS